MNEENEQKRLFTDNINKVTDYVLEGVGVNPPSLVLG